MNYYANDEQRVRLVAGLRDLADFLDQNPDVPAPWEADLLVFPPEASDAEMFAEIDTIAELIGSTASDERQPERPLQHGSQLRAGAVPRSRDSLPRP